MLFDKTLLGFVGTKKISSALKKKFPTKIVYLSGLKTETFTNFWEHQPWKEIFKAMGTRLCSQENVLEKGSVL